MPTPIHLKPPMAAWIVTQRKAKGWKPRDVVERLAALGLVVSEDTVKVWESNANRRPAPENIDGLERIFGSGAPEKDALPPDQSALIAALERQTRAIGELVAVVAEALIELRVSGARQDANGQRRAAHLLERIEDIAATVGAPAPEEAEPSRDTAATTQGEDAVPDRDQARHRTQRGRKPRLGPPRPGWDEAPEDPELRTRSDAR